jgi:hypothetical protein
MQLLNYFSCTVYLAGYLAISISNVRPDIWQVKSSIRPNTGYHKSSDYPAKYPMHRYFYDLDSVFES